MPNHWILTCNPKRWDIWGWLADGKSLTDIEKWSVVQHFAELTDGDDVALWVSGPERGVYAIGTIAGSPSPDEGDEHWLDADDRRRQRHYVPIVLSLDLSSSPIPGDELKGDSRFADATVITFPRGGNPHRLDDRQWQAISDRLPSGRTS